VAKKSQTAHVSWIDFYKSSVF